MAGSGQISSPSRHRSTVPWAVLVFVALTAALGACTSDGDAAGTDSAAEAADSDDSATSGADNSDRPELGRLVERPCDTAAELPPVECYWFEVPERRDVPDAATIRLWVAVVEGHGPAASDPVLFDLTGGPGDAASPPWVHGIEFGDEGAPTMVVIDQRGTGRSQPRLACPELDTLPAATEPYADQVAAHRDAAAACRDRLEEGGVDLAGYDTVESAADIVELRRALDLDPVVVRGFSYGGRLAIEVARQDPDGVAGLLLDSTSTTGPWTLQEVVDGADESVARLDAACAAAPDCAVHGSFSSNLERAAQVLDEQPYTVQPSGRVVDGAVLRWGMFQAMYDEDLVAVIPSAVASLANGQTELLDAFAGDLEAPPQDDIDGPAAGTFRVVSCADEGGDALTEDAEVLSDPGVWSQLVLGHSGWCEVWGVDDAGLADASGDMPVLALVGEMDPVHPLAFTEEAVAGFTNVTIVLVPGGAHGVSFSNDCTASISQAFLADPDAPLDTSCVEQLPPAFATS